MVSRLLFSRLSVFVCVLSVVGASKSLAVVITVPLTLATGPTENQMVTHVSMTPGGAWPGYSNPSSSFTGTPVPIVASGTLSALLDVTVNPVTRVATINSISFNGSPTTTGTIGLSDTNYHLENGYHTSDNYTMAATGVKETLFTSGAASTVNSSGHFDASAHSMAINAGTLGVAGFGTVHYATDTPPGQSYFASPLGGTAAMVTTLHNADSSSTPPGMPWDSYYPATTPDAGTGTITSALDGVLGTVGTFSVDLQLPNAFAFVVGSANVFGTVYSIYEDGIKADGTHNMLHATGTFQGTVSPIPEPGTMVMLLGLVATLAGYGWLKRR